MANNINIRVTGIGEAIRTVGATTEVARFAITALAERVHELAVDGAEDHSFEDASGGVSTGDLIRSITGPDRIQGGWRVKIDGQIARHGVFVHWGTRPHPITPNPPRQFLRWPVPGGFTVNGKTKYFRFAKKVHHPGYEGDPFMVTAAEKATREFPRIVRRIADATL